MGRTMATAKKAAPVSTALRSIRKVRTRAGLPDGAGSPLRWVAGGAAPSISPVVAMIRSGRTGRQRRESMCASAP
jgi:hypothetical protein